MHYDIVIVGSGLVGASLALALENQGFKIAILDNTPISINIRKDSSLEENNLENDNKKNDNTKIESYTNSFLKISNARAIALSYSSIQCLKAMNIWQQLENYATPIQKVEVTRKDHFGVSHITPPKNHHILGSVINADDLNYELNHKLNILKQHPTSSITIFRPAEIKKLQKLNDSWEIYCELEKNKKNKKNEKDDEDFSLSAQSTKRIFAKLLVAADGTHSYIRQSQGIEVESHDYQQTAIVCNIEIEGSHHNVAHERFIEEGTIAMLPFGQNVVKCIYVLSNRENKIKKEKEGKSEKNILELSDIEFLKKIQFIFGYRLGVFRKLGKRIQYPLKSVSAKALYGERMVLIGNAANTLHPVAAQGFNLGLKDVAALAETLVNAKKNQEDMGSSTVLKKYADWRQKDHMATKQFTENLIHSSPITSLGIFATEFLNPVKQWITHQGMGIQANSPKLLLGLSLQQYKYNRIE